MRILSRPKAPAKGVSTELLEIVVKHLRRRYGDRPIDSQIMLELEYHLGTLERKFAETDQERTA